MKYLQYNIQSPKDVMELIATWKVHKPLYISFDTETNGLNIMHHQPFLLAFGYLTNDFQTIYTYTVDLELVDKQIVVDVLYVFDKMCKYAEKILPHNGRYDCHMLANFGYPFNHWDKLSDTMFYIRLAHDAKIPKEGGAPLKLKEYTARFIDPNAKYFEQKLKDEITAKKKAMTKDLKARLTKK